MSAENWIAESARSGRQYIAGAWVPADSGASLKVVNPATGAVIASVPESGRPETRRAIEAAAAAGNDWRKTTAGHRGRILLKIHDLLVEHREGLAQLITAEQGKPLAEARLEIDQAASFFQWYGQESRRHYGDVIPSDRPDRRMTVLRQPIGVVGAITPWNMPSSMAARKVAPALAAGCTVVLKPAEATPLSALALAEIGERAGVPAGVLNVVTGIPAEIGLELTTNPVVRKITFTGSTAVGKLLATQASSTVKRLSLELGGNAPFIVFDDANLDVAVRGVVASRFRNAGQVCVAANRIYVHERIHDAFVARLTEAVAELVVGEGTAEGVQVGPLIDETAANKARDLAADAIHHGALRTGIESDDARGPAFVQPCVLAGVTEEMRLAREEIFAPIASVLRFATEDEVVERANSTPFGLAAYFYTADRARMVRVTEALEFGMVGVNECLVAYEGAPFGGMKESGMGREGSRYGLDDYTEMKYVCEGGLS